jgi:hypothetical protein
LRRRPSLTCVDEILGRRSFSRMPDRWCVEDNRDRFPEED